MSPPAPCPLCNAVPAVLAPWSYQTADGQKWGAILECCQGPTLRSEPVDDSPAPPVPYVPPAPLVACELCAQVPTVLAPWSYQTDDGRKWGAIVECCHGPELRSDPIPEPAP